jgi:hypothetical protein
MALFEKETNERKKILFENHLKSQQSTKLFIKRVLILVLFMIGINGCLSFNDYRVFGIFSFLALTHLTMHHRIKSLLKKVLISIFVIFAYGICVNITTHNGDGDSIIIILSLVISAGYAWYSLSSILPKLLSIPYTSSIYDDKYLFLTRNELKNTFLLGALDKNNLGLQNNIEYLFLPSEDALKIYNYVGVLVIDIDWKYLVSIRTDDQTKIVPIVRTRPYDVFGPKRTKIETTLSKSGNRYLILELEVEDAIKTLIFVDYSDNAIQEMFNFYQGRY